MDREPALSRLHADLGLKRLNRVWAKMEIVLGLLTAGIGLPLLIAGQDALFVGGGLALFVLGGYFTLTGHRSHLYQSNNLLTAYLADEIRKLHPKV